MARRLTFYILVGMVLGIVAGIALNLSIADKTRLAEVADWFTILTDIFLRLIKMIIAPLVFATLVVGIAHMGDTTALGRIGARTMAWFIGASIVSLLLGLVMVNLLHPGTGLSLPLPPPSESAGLDKAAFTLHGFFTHIFPASIFDAMAKNEILQIVIFSIFAGVALTAVGEKGAPIVRGLEALVAMMLQITDYVMRLAPFAVFAAIAHAVAINGIGIIETYARFVGSFYLSLALLWCVLFAAGAAVLGQRMTELARYIRDPILLAFSTASSEAAYPRVLEALDRFGVPRRIASFVLPLGYSFNLDGSMIYMTFATLFIAQAYGIHIGAGQQLLMVFTLMITSKGIAGVPRACLVVIAAELEQFGVPRRIASFVLPLGYSFNLDGSMIYMTFATLFVAQAYGIDIPIGQQIVMVLILMVTSKGMAGVPRASLVVIAAVMGHFGIPEAGLLLILAVDQFLDMGRSGTNVIGNAVATAVVAKWEGVLADTPPERALEPAPRP